MKKPIALTAAGVFLLLMQVSAVPSFAVDWQLWPKGRTAETVPPAKTVTPEAKGAEKAGESGGKAAAAGVSAGTIGWILGITAGAAVIGIAAGGGGGGGGTTATPAHP